MYSHAFSQNCKALRSPPTVSLHGTREVTAHGSNKGLQPKKLGPGHLVRFAVADRQFYKVMTTLPPQDLPKEPSNHWNVQIRLGGLTSWPDAFARGLSSQKQPSSALYAASSVTYMSVARSISTREVGFAGSLRRWEAMNLAAAVLH